jgi:signal transduction histidine kinase
LGVEGSLWRAVAALRWLSLPYALILVWANDAHYARPLAAWAALAFMAAWTVVVTTRRPRRRLLVADLAVCTSLLLLTRAVETAERLPHTPTLTVTWSAAPVIAWAILWGVWGGVGSGLVVGIATIVTKGRFDQSTGGSLVLLVLTGAVVGYVVRLALDAQARVAEAVALRGATEERERLARQIHDGVLQGLALIHRRGESLGGEAASLAAIAAEQEAALRSLVARPREASPAGMADVRDTVVAATRAATVPVEVATPNAPVLLPAAAAHELGAAVSAALDNVARHAGHGARAWVLVEDEGDAVTVSVRDDGAGFDVSGLAAAAEAGRLGVAQSIRGRAEALGGRASIESGSGGTEVEIRVPRPEVTTYAPPSR